MSELTREAIMRIMPEVLTHDEHMHDLAELVAEAFERIWAKVNLPMIYPRIDELPEDLLDILAKDFKVDWYDYDLGIEAKRALIKDNFFVHKHLGTVAAVKRALSDVWPNSTITEWFEYGGDPYYFRAVMEATQQRAPIVIDDLARAVELYKSCRSHLDGGAVTVRVTCGIIIKTHLDGQKYTTRISGTFPYVATHGDVGSDNVIVNTSSGQQTYTAPLSGTIRVGTYPYVSTHGNVSGSGVIIEAGEGMQEYHVPKSGTKPRTGTHGSIERQSVSLETASQNQAYETPRTGQVTTGTEPYAAVHGSIAEATVDVGVDERQTSYSPPVAGTVPATATHSGKDDGGMNIGVTSGEFQYTPRPCGSSNDSLF